MTWADAWEVLNADGRLSRRSQQVAFAEAVFECTTSGGTLLAEAGTGVGKSYGYLIPLIYRARLGERSVVSTETNALLDQLVDKDLPRLSALFGGFTYASLKGRRNYLCLSRSSCSPATKSKLQHAVLGRGERRDVERYFGKRLTDDEWDEFSGDADFCAQNRCQPETCWSTRARDRAIKSDIVVTNHALLQTHADVDDGILGDFKNLVVDEAHTLEAVLISGWSEILSPYDMNRSVKSVWDALGICGDDTMRAKADEADRLTEYAINDIIDFFELLEEERRGRPVLDEEWRRLSETISLKYLRGQPDARLVDAMTQYETVTPQRVAKAAKLWKELSKTLADEVDNAPSGKRKIRKGSTASKRLANVLETVSAALTTDDGIVMQYGVPVAVLVDGHKAWKGRNQAGLRCVPLDVSKRAAETVWRDPRAVVLVSATLTDSEQTKFGYTAASLGIEDYTELIVGSPFDYKKQQLMYLTPGGGEIAEIEGARFNMAELISLLESSDGRSLVLFTARSEMEWAAEQLKHSGFPHKILLQEKGAHKGDLAKEFHEDNSSVLFATKSFMTGVDFPGESCSLVVLVKYPNPRWDPECRARAEWWGKRRRYTGWYDREGTLVARQAAGRLIRSETDRGVVALLDQREGMHTRLVEAVGAGGYVTRELDDVKRWLS